MACQPLTGCPLASKWGRTKKKKTINIHHFHLEAPLSDSGKAFVTYSGRSVPIRYFQLAESRITDLIRKLAPSQSVILLFWERGESGRGQRDSRQLYYSLL